LTLVGQGRYDRDGKACNYKEIQTRLESDDLSTINDLTWLEHLGLTLGISSNDAYSPYQ